MNGGAIGIGFLAIIGLAAGIAVIVVIAGAFGRRSNQSAAGLIATIFGGVFAVALLAALVLPATTVMSHSNAPEPRPVAILQTTSDEASLSDPPSAVALSGQTQHHQGAEYIAPSDVTSHRIDYGMNRSRTWSTFPKLILAIISLSAMIVLARVAVDGRNQGGYSASARIVAALAFVGMCALLARFGQIL